MSESIKTHDHLALQDSTSRAEKYLSRFIVVAILITAGGLFALQAQKAPISYALVFNPYALISFASMAIDLVLVFKVIKDKYYTAESKWFLLFLGGAIVLALGEG